MANGEFVLKNVWSAMGGYELSAVMNNATIDPKVDIVEGLCFIPSGTLFKKRQPGAVSADFALAGYLNFTEVHPALVANLTAPVTRTVHIFGPNPVSGEICWLSRIVQGQYQIRGPVGGWCEYTETCMSDEVYVQGKLFDYSAVSATGNGNPLQLGAVSSTQKIYAALEVVADPAGSTPTLDAILQSSALGDFTDAQTRHTFSQITTRNALWAEVSGAITDQHWRFRYTVGGTGGPSFAVRAAAGIR